MLEGANIYAVVTSGVISLVGGVAIAMVAKRFDARGQAEAALIGIGPQIIREQNTRIDQLSSQIDDIYRREQECQRDLRETRRDLGHALQRIRAIEDRFPNFDDSWKFGPPSDDKDDG